MKPTFESILTKYDSEIVSSASQLRNVIFSTLKGVTEIPDTSANIIGYGFGPGYKDLICTIIPSKKGIKLGFNRGSELPDPKKMLTGSGKVHRYAEIKLGKNLKNSDLKRLLKEGLKAYKSRINTANR